MPARDAEEQRTIGLLGATGVGVGAIVGGGILVLAGVAYAATGPGAIVAFALDGAVALITALSFAEISSAFPESGGAYTFAKKVLSVRAAFGVGWILWFAYIVAGVLYALGFASYAVVILEKLWEACWGSAPAWLTGRQMTLLLAAAATVTYAVSLIRKATGGGQWATVGKVVLFCVLILAGVIAVGRQPLSTTSAAIRPFFSGGASGLFAAMGFTFIALQGFDLIAAIAGEIKEPSRNIPRAMFLSLGTALLIYLPLLFVVAAAGVTPGHSIAELAGKEPEMVIAVAGGRFMGPFGYWLVMVAAVLSTLSALHANILAASRVALSMARDHTLPQVLGNIDSKRKTPVMAIYATALTLVAILFMVPNLASAGAAASLIFLVSFTLAHGTAYLARSRAGTRAGAFRTPWFPLVPIGGGLLCAGLAVFQAIAVPSAGGIVVIWLGLGVILYLSLFASGAETHDAWSEGLDPSLVRLRGRSPLVLVPIANPQHAPALVSVATALAPDQVGRVLLLAIVRVPAATAQTSAAAARPDLSRNLPAAQEVVNQALRASYEVGHTPEALITAAAEPWGEIGRIAEEHDCESLLIGLGPLAQAPEEPALEALLNDVACDVAIMRAPPSWRLDRIHRLLVPVGGRGDQHELRARLIGSLYRASQCEVAFITVLPRNADAGAVEEARRASLTLARHSFPGTPLVRVLRADDPVAAILAEAHPDDLIVLGLRRVGRRAAFGPVTLGIARDAPCATVMVSRKA